MVRLLEDFYLVSNEKLSHPWDANAYLIPGDEPVLIDCGSSEGYGALKRALQDVGYAPNDIRHVIATHGHWDHLSGMAQLRAESDAELWLHPDDRLPVETGDPDRTAAFLYARSFSPVQVDRLLYDGDIVPAGPYRMQVIHTPGHSPGSVSLLTEIDGIKLLIAGDTLWGGFHAKIGSDVDEWTHSLDRLLEFDFNATTIGHSLPALIFDAKSKAREARQQFGMLFNPWFKPFNLRLATT